MFTILKSLKGRPFLETFLLGPPGSLALVNLGTKKLPPERVIDGVRIPLLGNDDVIEVAGHFLLALFAVRSVPYTERLLHAWHLRPTVERMPAARVSLLRGRGGRRLDIHGITIAGIGEGRATGVG